jgi:hypothetical protein
LFDGSHYSYVYDVPYQVQKFNAYRWEDECSVYFGTLDSNYVQEHWIPYYNDMVPSSIGEVKNCIDSGTGFEPFFDASYPVNNPD